MTVPTRKYNPGFLSDDELVASFCVRTVEFDSMVEMLRDCDGQANPHQIVIGPRGCGKTSLLLRVAAEIRRDADLSRDFFPVIFAEESYEVATVGEFWLEALSRLAEAPGQEHGTGLSRTLEELRSIGDDRMLGERCLGTLLDFSDRVSRRLVLTVENLDMMFRDMTDPQDAGWRLRKTLQTEPRIVLLASATSRFDEIDSPDRAFYDLFRVLTLRPLNTDECAVLWKRVSGRRRAPGAVRALQILTGGSPRLLAIVARFGAGLSFQELMANLLNLVDDHTEYFKSHLEALPAQERRVYLALAELWKPASAREIASRVRIDTSKCSAQLARLVTRGAVETDGGTRRKLYYVTERLFNIYYLMRRSSRGNAPLVEALVCFMESYYSPSELRHVTAHIARDLRVVEIQKKQLYRNVYQRLNMMPISAEVDLSSAKRAGREQIRATLDEFWKMCRRRIRDDEEPDGWQVFFEMAELLVRIGRGEDALAFCDEIVRGAASSGAAPTLQEVAIGLIVKAKVLGSLNRREEELSVFDEVVYRCGASHEPAVLEHVASALHRKGNVLRYLNRQEEELVVLDEIIRRFGAGDTSAIRERVAEALFDKARVLGSLHRTQEQLATYDEVVCRYGSVDERYHRYWVLMALLDKALIFSHMKKTDEELSAYDEAARRLGQIDAPDAQARIARALLTKGFALSRIERMEEGLATHWEMVRRFGTSEAPAIREMTEIVLFSIAEVELQRRRYESAVEVVGQALARADAGSSAHYWRGLLIRARTTLEDAAIVRDVEAALAILPTLGSLPEDVPHELTKLCAHLGLAQTRELIAASPAADLLLPYRTALEMELGIETRVAREVEEVAQDIRREHLTTLRNQEQS